MIDINKYDFLKCDSISIVGYYVLAAEKNSLRTIGSIPLMSARRIIGQPDAVKIVEFSQNFGSIREDETGTLTLCTGIYVDICGETFITTSTGVYVNLPGWNSLSPYTE